MTRQLVQIWREGGPFAGWLAYPFTEDSTEGHVVFKQELFSILQAAHYLSAPVDEILRATEDERLSVCFRYDGDLSGCVVEKFGDKSDAVTAPVPFRGVLRSAFPPENGRLEASAVDVVSVTSKRLKIENGVRVKGCDLPTTERHGGKIRPGYKVTGWLDFVDVPAEAWLFSSEDLERLTEPAVEQPAAEQPAVEQAAAEQPATPNAVTVNGAPVTPADGEVQGDVPTTKTSQEHSNAGEQKKILRKRCALIQEFVCMWPTIESDLKDGSRNDLSLVANDKHGYWKVRPALEWAQERGKIQRNNAEAFVRHDGESEISALVRVLLARK